MRRILALEGGEVKGGKEYCGELLQKPDRRPSGPLPVWVVCPWREHGCPGHPEARAFTAPNPMRETLELTPGIKPWAEVGYQRAAFSPDTRAWEIRKIVDRKLHGQQQQFFPAMDVDFAPRGAQFRSGHRVEPAPPIT